MANIPLLLKDFRQQVLTQAVTGKLTEEWRKGKKLGEWVETKLSDFSISKLGKMLDGAKNTGTPVNYLRNINIRWFDIDFSDLNQMKVELDEMHKYVLLKGDVLVCEGGEPGRAAIWKYDRNDVIFQKALHRVRLNENVLLDFFLYNLKIDSLNNKLEELFTGTTIKHLTGRSFSTYTILVPRLEEQQEIVHRVKSLFAKADAIEQQYKTLKASIDTLPQALLHKAFKGELSEQLDSDGDARELLKEIKGGN